MKPLPRDVMNRRVRRRQRRIAFIACGAAVGMLGLSFASVPLYRLFCAATGYGGTTQIAAAAPALRGERQLSVRFDANVAPGLSWSFAPETPQITLRTGQTATVFFKATNLADHETVARASFNVSPDNSGAYFDKIACFCFEEQRLGARETAEMPVVFFLDPALEKDEGMAGVDEITLSYTFFAVKQASPVAAAAVPLAKPRL